MLLLEGEKVNRSKWMENRLAQILAHVCCVDSMMVMLGNFRLKFSLEKLRFSREQSVRRDVWCCYCFSSHTTFRNRRNKMWPNRTINIPVQ